MHTFKCAYLSDSLSYDGEPENDADASYSASCFFTLRGWQPGSQVMRRAPLSEHMLRRSLYAGDHSSLVVAPQGAALTVKPAACPSR